MLNANVTFFFPAVLTPFTTGAFGWVLTLGALIEKIEILITLLASSALQSLSKLIVVKLTLANQKAKFTKTSNVKSQKMLDS